MPDYQKAKIYRMTCDDPELFYYGATCQSLTKRLSRHKQGGYKSQLLFDVGGVKIELVEKCPCNDKEELNAIEARFIRENKCVNKKIPGRTSKEYREENKEKFKEKKRVYYKENKDKFDVKQRKYREDNKEKISEKKRKYYEEKKMKVMKEKQEAIDKLNNLF